MQQYLNYIKIILKAIYPAVLTAVTFVTAAKYSLIIYEETGVEFLNPISTYQKEKGRPYSALNVVQPGIKDVKPNEDPKGNIGENPDAPAPEGINQGISAEGGSPIQPSEGVNPMIEGSNPPVQSGELPENTGTQSQPAQMGMQGLSSASGSQSGMQGVSSGPIIEASSMNNPSMVNSATGGSSSTSGLNNSVNNNVAGSGLSLPPKGPVLVNNNGAKGSIPPIQIPQQAPQPIAQVAAPQANGSGINPGLENKLPPGENVIILGKQEGRSSVAGRGGQSQALAETEVVVADVKIQSIKTGAEALGNEKGQQEYEDECFLENAKKMPGNSSEVVVSEVDIKEKKAGSKPKKTKNKRKYTKKKKSRSYSENYYNE